MRVFIEIDGHRRKTTVERGSHPQHADDMRVLSDLLDATYRDARAWMDRAMNRPSVPTTPTEES